MRDKIEHWWRRCGRGFYYDFIQQIFTLINEYFNNPMRESIRCTWAKNTKERERERERERELKTLKKAINGMIFELSEWSACQLNVHWRHHFFTIDRINYLIMRHKGRGHKLITLPQVRQTFLHNIEPNSSHHVLESSS
jgi:hypothetical protein